MVEKVWTSLLVRGVLGYLLIGGLIPWVYLYRLQHLWYLFYTRSNLPQSGWKSYVIWYIPQELIYCLLPLVLYLLIVRPFKLRPLTKYAGLPKYTITFVCILATFILLTPFKTLTSSTALMAIVYSFTGFSEEWMFRGVFLHVFRDRVGVVLACVLSALLFGLYHWADDIIQLHGFTLGVLSAMSGQAVFGLVFSVIVLRSRSILWAGVLHSFADWQPWTDGDRSWITIPNILPNWIGGQYIMIFLIGLIGAEVIRLISNIITNRMGGNNSANSYEEISPLN